jgi:thioredoxin 1
MPNKVLLKASASWCQPCKNLQNVIDSTELNVDEIQLIDIDENPDFAYEYGIRGIPTLILYEDGSEVRRTSGSLTKEQLIQFIGD